MTLQIDLTPEIEDRLRDKAAREGLSPGELARRLIENGLPAFSPSTTTMMTPAERAAAFRAWADSRDPNTPVLSDEAISRDSIYEGRG